MLKMIALFFSGVIPVLMLKCISPAAPSVDAVIVLDASTVDADAVVVVGVTVVSFDACVVVVLKVSVQTNILQRHRQEMGKNNDFKSDLRNMSDICRSKDEDGDDDNDDA
ncbi:Hypothetical predicted protein [Octopus vulgaris]|uniref:Uncharacterized protein n=1 Tax=Octopus vulgaris TaxID=6645 RepID=A0AA36BHV2_OCTVU|nr:Hypothetical predicted protein [Octopus vulgaris]